jgi:hypothetical protein
VLLDLGVSSPSTFSRGSASPATPPRPLDMHGPAQPADRRGDPAPGRRRRRRSSGRAPSCRAAAGAPLVEARGRPSHGGDCSRRSRTRASGVADGTIPPRSCSRRSASP